MHMADALISPAVGVTMLAVSGGALAYALNDVRKNFPAEKIPLMGIAGAFVFAAQMINFAIPGTGSSGHIGGAMLLAALLGSSPAFIVLSAVLMIQALFFADGGLLALGCNIFNMGFIGCFIAYPLIFKPLAGKWKNRAGVMTASTLSVVVSLQFGAFFVVLETLLSGVTELPFSTFAVLMQPIHLAIGVIEGLLTGMVLLFLHQAQPGLLDTKSAELPKRAVAGALLAAALLLGGGLSLLASGDPDGLEWAIERTAAEEVTADTPVHSAAGMIQEKVAVLPDYTLPEVNEKLGTSFAGLFGVILTLFFIVLVTLLVKRKRRPAQQ